MKITIEIGDITQVPSDALITTVTTSGIFLGSIDEAIYRVAGGMFHRQLTERDEQLESGSFVLATSTQAHGGAFQHVIFAIDELDGSLWPLVIVALEMANDNGYKTVTIPLLRCGVMAGKRESRAEAMEAILDAAIAHSKSDTDIEELIIVVDHNSDAAGYLNARLARKMAT